MGKMTTLRKSALVMGATALLLVQPATASAQASADAQSYSASRIDGQTEVEKTIGRCAAAVVAGALVGALLGGRNAGRGAAIGAAAGVGVCAFMMSVASNRDKAHLRELQLQALNTGQAQEAWQTSDGKAASATITTSNVVDVSARKTGEMLKCRRATTHLSVDGQGSDATDIVCLHGDSWLTLDKLKALGVEPGDVTV
jgi:hypothetical protein